MPDDAPTNRHYSEKEIRQERTVEGTLTEVQREEILAEIRSRFRKAGMVSQVGRTLEWTHSERNDQQQVTITSRGGRTQIRLFERFPKIAILTFGVPLSIMLQAAITVPALFEFGALAGWAWALGLLAATYLAARFGYSQIVRGKERKARELLDRLERIAAAPVRQSPAATAAHADPALLDEEADDAEQASDPIRERRRTSS